MGGGSSSRRRQVQPRVTSFDRVRLKWGKAGKEGFSDYVQSKMRSAGSYYTKHQIVFVKSVKRN